jgi:hypothetical protein
MESLPNLVNYSEPLSVLPDGMQNYSVTCTPVNGSAFGPSQQIIVDLNNVGYLDPASLMIRYNVTYTTTATTVAAAATQGVYGAISGCPVYSPFLRLDTLMNSNVIESVNNYNSLCSMISNVNMSVAGKLGQQFCLGYNDTFEYNENTDGYIAGIQGSAATGQILTRTLYLCAPLPCLLSNAEKLIPLNGTNIRLQFTTDALANFCPLITTTDVTSVQLYSSAVGTAGLAGLISTVVTANAASQFTSMSIANFEVVYNQVQFPPHIDQEIRMQSPKIRIKTTSFATGAQTIPSGSLGTSNLIYNLRYASIKGLFLMNGGSGANSRNKLLESFDMTRGGITLGTGGSYQFGVNGINYPMNPINTAYNKGFALQELRRAMNNIYQNNVDMSVNSNEFNIVDGGLSSVYVPAKFYVAVNTQRLSVPYKALFTGISSQNSPITAIINLGTVATSQQFTCILAIYYDAIIEIDLATKQVNYIY